MIGVVHWTVTSVNAGACVTSTDAAEDASASKLGGCG